MEIRNQKIILTGGAGSVGKFLAEKLGQEGAKVIIIDNNIDKLEQILSENPNLVGYPCNLVDYEEVTKCIHDIFVEHPNISVLINNAGLIYSTPLINLASSAERRHDFLTWQKVLDANLTSTFNTGVSVIDKMIQNRTKGLIINISSISAAGNPGQTAYSAAKAGVDALTSTWCKEVSILGIRVAGVSPGFFDSTSTKEALSENNLDKLIKKIPSQRLGKLDELYKSIKFIIENDYFNGKVLDIDGGLII